MTFRFWCGLTVASLVAGCAAPPAAPLTMADLPEVDAARLMSDIEQLASDAFEGRQPGTAGETRTVQYLIDQFKSAGLLPGNPDGSWTQTVPIVSMTTTAQGPLVVRKGTTTRSFRLGQEIVPFTHRVTDRVAIDSSELVFAGYGVQAPELGWDDFRGMDVTGKTLVVLVNDPPVPSTTNPAELDPAVFGGRAMTYYGRWTYKLEQAAALGAAGCIIVHETGPAGYPFSVVQGFGGGRTGLVTADRNMHRVPIEAWMSLDAATALFKMAGLDYQAEKARAATRAFTPRAMGLTASIALTQTMRTTESKNVVAKLPGADPALADDVVVYAAHWDHLGTGDPRDGDAIYNGAADNASGTAALLGIARSFKAVRTPPRRSIVFLAVTAEESGLLGSEYYVRSPLYPLNRTLAAINLDMNLPLWGRTKDITVIGLGASDLDEYVRQAASEMDRVVRPDPSPEEGHYYRSDHFSFAKVGIPALFAGGGREYLGKPADFGPTKAEQFRATAYHSPDDEVNPAWDLSGLAEQAKLLLAVGYRVAQADRYPEWAAGNEFRAVREASMRKEPVSGGAPAPAAPGRR